MVNTQDFPLLGHSRAAVQKRPITQLRSAGQSVVTTKLTAVALSRLEAPELASLPALLKKAFGPDHPEFIKGIHKLAALHHAREHVAEAMSLYCRALASAERVFGARHLETAHILNNLGRLLYDQGDYRQAEELFWRAVETMQQILGPEHRKLATPLGNLATLYRHQGKRELADRLGEQGLKLLQKALGPNHPKVIKARMQWRV